MTDTANWDRKIRFFSKFLGYEDEDQDETLDETNKSCIVRKNSKGIKIVQNPVLYHSMILTSEHNQDIDRRWLNLIRTPFRSASKNQLCKLAEQGTSYPHKILPWLAQNKNKINLKLFNLRRAQYRTHLNQNNPFRLQKMPIQIQILHMKNQNTAPLELLSVFMLQREDIQYSDTLLSIGNTVNSYLFDAPVVAFSLLYSICCNDVMIAFLTNDVDKTGKIIQSISKNVYKNCSSSSFLIRDHINIEFFIRDMIESFWGNISDNKTSFRQKILYYLLIHQFNIKAISHLCESSVNGLSRILNYGVREKSLVALNNPKAVMDEQLFLHFLFKQQQ